MTRWLVPVAAVLALLLAADSLRLFWGEQWLAGLLPLENHLYFGLLGLLLPLSFLVYPTYRWLDGLLALLTLLVCAYGFWHAEAIVDEGWEFVAPTEAIVAAALLWILLLEAVRRAGGTALAIIATVFSLLPIYTEWLPGPLQGLGTSWADAAAYHAYSIESIFGLPFRAFAQLVMGFLLFGVALQHTGGGKFFLNLAFALLGRVRGGPAKVAVLSSGLMGSMSGSVVTNVLTTGQLTIPAMRQTGFRSDVAGGIEACASTGGVLLPPIMGSTAFIMATFLEVPYSQVAIAAALPALLYFLALFIQVDAYAGKHELAGVTETPSLVATMRDGWYYLGAFALLVVLLVVMQREAIAPYYATVALLVLNQLSAEHRWDWAAFGKFLDGLGRLLAELVTVLAGVGLIVGALSVTGLSGTLVNDLLFLAGDQLWLLILMGAATSFVLGIGMTVTAAYIFLAIVLAPALVQAGLPPMAVHLFILYWAMLSFITPPVALGAFAAASIAQARPLQTGLTAMQLGGIVYVLPFAFLLDSTLLLEGGALNTLLVLAETVIAVWLAVGGLQGFLIGIGAIPSFFSRLMLVAGGVLLLLPGLDGVGIALTNLPLAIAAVALVGVGLSRHRLGGTNA